MPLPITPPGAATPRDGHQRGVYEAGEAGEAGGRQGSRAGARQGCPWTGSAPRGGPAIRPPAVLYSSLPGGTTKGWDGAPVAQAGPEKGTGAENYIRGNILVAHNSHS